MKEIPFEVLCQVVGGGLSGPTRDPVADWQKQRSEDLREWLEKQSRPMPVGV